MYARAPENDNMMMITRFARPAQLTQQVSACNTCNNGCVVCLRIYRVRGKRFFGCSFLYVVFERATTGGLHSLQKTRAGASLNSFFYDMIVATSSDQRRYIVKTRRATTRRDGYNTHYFSRIQW